MAIGADCERLSAQIEEYILYAGLGCAVGSPLLTSGALSELPEGLILPAGGPGSLGP